MAPGFRAELGAGSAFNQVTRLKGNPALPSTACRQASWHPAAGELFSLGSSNPTPLYSRGMENRMATAARKQAKTRKAKKSGTAKRVGTAATGKETLLDVLHREHDEVAELLDGILETEDSAERTRLFDQMKPSLIAHLHGEEQVFYPLLKAQEDKNTKTEAIEGFLEHHLAAGMAEQLAKMKPNTSEEWTARCKVLKDLVEHHVEEEESTIWKEARKHLGKDKLQELKSAYEAAKEKFLAHA